MLQTLRFVTGPCKGAITVVRHREILNCANVEFVASRVRYALPAMHGLVSHMEARIVVDSIYDGTLLIKSSRNNSPMRTIRMNPGFAVFGCRVLQHKDSIDLNGCDAELLLEFKRKDFREPFVVPTIQIAYTLSTLGEMNLGKLEIADAQEP